MDNISANMIKMALFGIDGAIAVNFLMCAVNIVLRMPELNMQMIVPPHQQYPVAHQVHFLI